jgi:hypothetical protein
MAAHPSDASLCVRTLPGVDAYGYDVNCLSENVLRNIAPHHSYQILDVVGTMEGRVLLPNLNSNTVDAIARSALSYRQENPECRVILMLHRDLKLLIGHRATVDDIVKAWFAPLKRASVHEPMFSRPSIYHSLIRLVRRPKYDI